MRLRLVLTFSAFAVLAQTALAKDDSVLATVNGAPILRADALDRTWKEYGTTVLNEMVDEILTHQAVANLKVQTDGSEVEARLTRIRGQFKDEATFQEKLGATGASLSGLRLRIEEQVLRETLVRKAQNITVTEDETRQYFDANKDKLGSASVHLRHILVASEKEANDFMVAAKAGADFGKMASQISLDLDTKEKGGDLGFISKGQFPPELEKFVFSIREGEIGGPVKSPAGFVIFKVEAIRPAKAMVYNDVKKELAQSLLADKTSKAWPTYIQALRDAAKIVPAASEVKNRPRPSP